MGADLDHIASAKHPPLSAGRVLRCLLDSEAADFSYPLWFLPGKNSIFQITSHPKTARATSRPSRGRFMALGRPVHDNSSGEKTPLDASCAVILKIILNHPSRRESRRSALDGILHHANLFARSHFTCEKRCKGLVKKRRRKTGGPRNGEQSPRWIQICSFRNTRKSSVPGLTHFIREWPTAADQMPARTRILGSARSTYRTGYAFLADSCVVAFWRTFSSPSRQPFVNKVV